MKKKPTDGERIQQIKEEVGKTIKSARSRDGSLAQPSDGEYGRTGASRVPAGQND